MRIMTLHLKAYGPFTDARLDFAGDLPGLHVVHGANEAGKSSALRALTDFLYGIPERTRDGFLHGNDQLRIGGTLRLADGREGSFVRRKGRKNTLLTPDEGGAVDDRELALFLSGVSREMFATMFGIDHEELVRGGNELLTQRGRVGEALLAAAIGSEKFRALLKELEEAAAELFLPRASKPRINAGLAEFKALRDRARRESLPAREWDRHWTRRRELVAEVRRIDGEIGARQGERQRLLRIGRVLKGLAERRELIARLAAMGEVHILAADFPSRRAAVLRDWEHAREAVARAGDRLANLRAVCAKLPPPSSLLAEAVLVDELQQDLGSHLKALRDRPDLEGRLRQMRNDARRLMETIGIEPRLESVGEIIPQVERNRALVTELARRHEAVLTSLKKAEKTLERRRRDQEETERELRGLPEGGDPAALREAVRVARKEGDPDGELFKARKALQEAEGKAQRTLAGLGRWRGDMEAALILSVPARESIERCEGEWRRLEERRREIERAAGENAAETLAVRKKLTGFALAGMVPTEQDLEVARRRREEGWRLIRGLLAGDARNEDGERRFHADLPPPEAYEDAVTAADDIADRLRREAQRVHVLADLRAADDSLAERRRQLERETAELVAQEKKRDDDWHALWAPGGIEPLSPREMAAWLSSFHALREEILRAQAAREELLALEARHASTCASLREALRPLRPEPHRKSELFRDLREEAEHHLEVRTERNRRRGEMRRQMDRQAGQVREAAGEKETARAELRDWQERWRAAMTGLGLSLDTPPAPALSVLDQYTALFGQTKQIADMDRRIWAINEEARRFTEKVAEFVRRRVPEYAACPPEEVVRRLKQEVDGARLREKERQNGAKRVREAEEELRAAATDFRVKEQRVADLLKEARCRETSEFEAAEARSVACQGCRERLAAVERFLLENGDGLPVTVLEAEAAAVSPDELPAVLTEVNGRLEELQSRRQELNTEIGEENAELRRMDGSSAAAEAEEQVQAALASLRGDVARYTRIRAAFHLLKNAMNRYREKNQAPLLLRAGELFGRITAGAFPRLMTDIGPEDEPVLMGVRSDGARLGVEGMSSGTRDQLYLALRLATAETYFQGEPLPFIVDDVLVNFDEERTAATLRVLREMGRHTQVILFTHHRHLAALAEELAQAGAGVAVRKL
ncbi:MAG TPA: AAA family ATPase [Syntrophales bacterium]|mgnify:CR=1 FL=1|nr:AAA family ATPase [Syntrophales bacterium]